MECKKPYNSAFTNLKITTFFQDYNRIPSEKEKVCLVIAGCKLNWAVGISVAYWMNMGVVIERGHYFTEQTGTEHFRHIILWNGTGSHHITSMTGRHAIPPCALNYSSCRALYLFLIVRVYILVEVYT